MIQVWSDAFKREEGNNDVRTKISQEIYLIVGNAKYQAQDVIDEWVDSEVRMLIGIPIHQVKYD